MASLSEDPTVLAWRRALGFEDATDQANAAQQTAQVQQRVAFQVPEVQYQGDLAQQNISGNFEDRGLFRSGEHERGLAQQAHSTQYQLGSLELGGAQQLGDIQATLAQQIAARNRQLAEQSLGLAQTMETQSGTRAIG